VARTKAEIAEYNRAYWAEHADELGERHAAWYEAHREAQVARATERVAQKRAQLGEHATEMRRIQHHLAVGRRAGLTETEAWWFALQCEAERNQHGENALRGVGKTQALITAIIEDRPILAKLDAARWAAPTGDQAAVVVDDGYELEDAS
jgi:hypothetical protein